MEKEAVGSRVRVLRKQCGLSIKELAARTGVSYATIHRIEKGHHSPSVATLSGIAHQLGYSLTALLSHPDPGITIIRAAEQPGVDGRGLELRLFAPRGLIDQRISMAIGQMAAGDRIAPHRNAGRELSYMISGSCIFTYGGMEYTLKKSDTVWFAGDQLHSVDALEDMEFLAVLQLEQPAPQE
ncbi:MAG: helix-turn-helix domain-containing protein [Deltaproteobacteria bacterium]|nr:helix-turn-helix domain-containing protein [Deltaproteobacteria bacterium]